MSHASWVDHTAAGGAGALSLVAIAGSPSYAAAFGTTGTRTVRYTVTNSAGTKMEAGFGTVTLSTLSLARDVPVEQFSGTTLVRIAITAPLDFTADGTVNVRCTAMSSTEAPTAHATGNLGTNGYGFGMIGNAFAAGGNGVYQPAGTAGVYLYPFKWVGTRPIKRAAFYINTYGAAGSTSKFGLMEMTPAGGFNLIADFSSISGPINTASGGSGTRTLVAGTDFPEVYVPPGMYALAWAPSNNPCQVFSHQQVTHDASAVLGCLGDLSACTSVYMGGSGSTLSQTIAAGVNSGVAGGNSNIPVFRFGFA